MHRLFGFACAAAVLTSAGSRALAWDYAGHATVAMIAWDQMSPELRAKCVAILKNHPREREDLMSDIAPGENPDEALFVRAATWPDLVRSRNNPLNATEHHPAWHYIDLPFDLDGVKGPEPVTTWDGHSMPTNLVQAMDKVTHDLTDPAAGVDKGHLAIDMCWVEHLVGDIHQPLHATEMFSSQFPKGDQGGNLLFVHFPPADFDINLHAFWDEQEDLPREKPQGFIPARPSYDSIRGDADRVEKEHPRDELKTPLTDMSVIDWAHESFSAAKSIVYEDGNIPHDTKSQELENPDTAPALTADYIAKAHKEADLRIALAGYRLANQLEQMGDKLPSESSK